MKQKQDTEGRERQPHEVVFFRNRFDKILLAYTEKSTFINNSLTCTMLQKSLLIPAIAALLFSACLPDPSAPENQHYDGTNGMVVNGGSFSNVTIETPSSTATTTFNGVTVVMDGIINGLAVRLTMVMPITAPATVGWNSTVVGPPDSVSAMMTIGDDFFTGVSGIVTIEEYGEIGDIISGQFSGRFEDSFGTGVNIDGIFRAQRRE